jgi:hypothetical protein
VNVERVDVDSNVLGRSVLAIHDFDANADFPAFERTYVKDHDPFYVSCKIPLERISSVHLLEKAGFNFIECQVQASITLRKPFDVSVLPYSFEQITRESELAPVLEIAASTFTCDRFAIDPVIGQELAGKRCAEYVHKSFRSPEEYVYRLVDRSSGRTVAFKTHRLVGNAEVLFLLGGVHPDFKNIGLGAANDYFEFNELIRSGIKRGVTHVSARNHAVVNLELGNLGFRVLATSAVMRKIYAQTPE